MLEYTGTVYRHKKSGWRIRIRINLGRSILIRIRAERKIRPSLKSKFHSFKVTKWSLGGPWTPTMNAYRRG
jgi:hypothetical protein